MSEPTSTDLMLRAQTGDMDAFAELYDRYRNQILRYAEARHPGHGDDIAQDVWVKTLRSLHLWHDQGLDPAAWLLTMTANLCRDRGRSAHHRLSSPADFTDPACHQEADPTADPEMEALARLLARRVRDGLRGLTVLQRTVLILHYLHGLPHAQIGERLGMPAVNVKEAALRGRRALARRLGGRDV